MSVFSSTSIRLLINLRLNVDEMSKQLKDSVFVPHDEQKKHKHLQVLWLGAQLDPITTFNLTQICMEA